jgi:hypothetical protein
VNPTIAAKIKAQQFGPEACEKRNGLLAYKDNCDFLKPSGDDGNPTGRPDIVESGQNSGSQGTNGYDSARWLSSEQQQLPTRERSTGPDSGSNVMIPPMMFANHRVTPNGGYVDTQSNGTNDMSVSPHPDSNRPTPNSSSASEQRNNSTSAPSRPVTDSGRTSYDASPIGGNQTLGTQAEIDAATVAFFSDANNYGMPTQGTGMTPGRNYVLPDNQGNHYAVSDGWAVMPGQTGMTPVAEGVLRHLMDMPPMDAMDLGWEGA